MQRSATTIIGLAVVALAVWLVVHNFQPPKPIGHDAAQSDAASIEAGGPTFPSALAVPSGDDAGPLLLSDLVSGDSDRRIDAGVGATMPDGTPVPLLPAGAPREVRFGVVLISYAGAQPGVGGTRPASRSREDARALAAKLLATARQDFHAAVQQGDAGSSDDVGRVKLGILEPAPEYVLFTLASGGVGGPVDTPRGYWIVKRLD